MATYLSGSVRKATPNTVEAMRRSAEARRCRACDRKSAMSTERFDDPEPGQVYAESVCRWCGYTRSRVRTRQPDGRWKVEITETWPDGRTETREV